jgi:tripartite-type tricarboxylate transporter receptor subunit TctC
MKSDCPNPADMLAQADVAEPQRRMRRTLLVGAAAVAGMALAGPLRAQQSFPSRPVRFVVPFPPGSGTDTIARIYAKKIGEAAGQPVVVENKPGGNGFIGVQAVLNAPADGHTIFIGSNSTLSTNAAVFKRLPYDPLVDFAPISLLSRAPCLIIAPPNSPYRTIANLVADARKRPGALNYGAGSAGYTLYAEWMNEIAKIKATNVPFKGAGDAITAVMQGTVDYAVVDSGGAIELARSGRLRALAVSAPKRSDSLPDVPTAIEAGLPDYLAWTWVAAAVSAKTPAPLVERIVALFKQAASQAETKEYHQQRHYELVASTPADMKQYQATEIERWKRLVAVAGLELQ